MRTRLNQSRTEWGMIALLAALCVALSLLQYHWTGQVSRAEAEHLRAGLHDEAEQFCQSFDSTLTEACEALTPSGEAVGESNRIAVHLQHFQKWKSARLRPIFRRIAVAVPTPSGAQLFAQNLETGLLEETNWPKDWDSVNLFLSHRPMAGPPLENFQGMVFVAPIFDGRPDENGPPRRFGPPDDMNPSDGGKPPRGFGPPREPEWMVFELDPGYLQNTWLPELTQRFLDPDGQALSEMEIKTAALPKSLIFSSPLGATNRTEAPVKVAFNRQGQQAGQRWGPGRDPVWELDVRPHLSSLDNLVNTSRRRNLAVALFLNALILAAGIALLFYTRRSRELAHAQMQFVAAVSHELRTPLTVIRGAGHNLQRGIARDPSQIEQYSKLIVQHAEQLTHMVEQILELAGVQKNPMGTARKAIAVEQLLLDAVASTKADIEAAACQIEFKIVSGLPPVWGDPASLQRVFQNLITNAAKHAGEGHWIGLTASNSGSLSAPTVEIEVTDHGPGIPKSEIPHIFEPFFRGAAAQAKQIRGAGLGLSLVREIVEAHGGSVRVQSQAGQGTTFVVRLPVAKT